jgi:hypothetical protein
MEIYMKLPGASKVRSAAAFLAVLSFCSLLFAAQSAYADSQNFTSNGTFTVPYYTGSLSVTVNGAGGGGGGGYGASSYTCGKSTCYSAVSGNAGGDGGGSTFNTSVVGNGGAGGGGGNVGGGGGNGTASGGDTNTTGGGAGGGARGTDCTAYVTATASVAGGAGGQAVKAYAVGALTPGAGIAVTVGSAGSAGAGGVGTTCTGGNGTAGTAGNVNITWTPDTTAPTPNPATFSTSPTPDSASQVSMTATTASDNYAVQYSFAFSACGSNGGTGGTSSGWQSSASYSDSGLQPNQCYGYTVQSRDAIPNTGTASSQNTTYTYANTPSAPTLSSASYHSMVITNNENSNPSANPTTYFAAQVTTSDSNWSSKYIDASGNASASAVWLTDAQLTSLTINSMANNTSYTIAVKARNQNSVETSFGSGATLSTLNDTTAPTPNPATFSTAPTPDSASQISMTATTASDAEGSTPVAYSFAFSACGSNGGTGGTSSGWQSSASYSDSGLQPNQCYGYTVQSRDAIPNTGTASSQNTTYTLANTPGTPTVTNPTQTTLIINNNENSNPSSNPSTQYAVQIIAAGDSTWNNKYTDQYGNPNASAVWLTSAQAANIIITGLTAGVTYQAQVKARNYNNVETSFSSTASNTTSSTVSTTPREVRLRGTRLRGVRLLYAPSFHEASIQSIFSLH